MPPQKKQTQSLEGTLRGAATALRPSMDAAECKHVVLGLVVLKYVSDTFMVRHDELARLVDDEWFEYFMPTEAVAATGLILRRALVTPGESLR